MNIIEAAKLMNIGRNVRRRSWENPEFFIRLYVGDTYPCLVGPEDGPDIYLDCDDLLAEDWEVVAE